MGDVRVAEPLPSRRVAPEERREIARTVAALVGLGVAAALLWAAWCVGMTGEWPEREGGA